MRKAYYIDYRVIDWRHIEGLDTAANATLEV